MNNIHLLSNLDTIHSHSENDTVVYRYIDKNYMNTQYTSSSLKQEPNKNKDKINYKIKRWQELF